MKWFSNLKIIYKLLLILGALRISTILMGLSGINFIVKMGNQTLSPHWIIPGNP
jgi:hypothetical protein